jgi:2-oxo-4-hydroxy-4-carboxy-5-ureidoimidazoline decarboxylase
MLSLARLNALPPGEAAVHFRSCCAASRWTDTMVNARPFASRTHLFAIADAAWEAAGPDDWHEAFAAHPRIGELANAALAGDVSRAWSDAEQSRATEASDETRREIATLNAEYERRFGRIYIVCASGRTGADLLADLRSRLGNTAERELEIAAREQHRITRLRLEQLISAEEA